MLLFCDPHKARHRGKIKGVWPATSCRLNGLPGHSETLLAWLLHGVESPTVENAFIIYLIKVRST
jgi:hypothetical protein